MNFGVQRQLHPGTVLSVDYVRSVGTHTLLGLDTNKVGDARFLNCRQRYGLLSTPRMLHSGVVTVQTGITCAIGKGAQITDYAGNGLDSWFGFRGAAHLAPPCAFLPASIQPLGQNESLFPIGRSVLQTRFLVSPQI